MSHRLQNIVMLLLLSAVLLLLTFNTLNTGPGGEAGASVSPRQLRELANKLKQENLHAQAAETYIRYMRIAGLNNSETAAVSYNIANLYRDCAEYEKALAYFYQVQVISPESDLARKAGSNIVNCLEKMGRLADARYALAEATAAAKDTSAAGGNGPVVAEIGKRKIRKSEINRALQMMPEFMQKEMLKPSRREEFVKNYVVGEVLRAKALRQGLDKAPEIRKKMEQYRKNLIVSEFLEKAVRERVKPTPENIALFYKANKEMFTRPARVRIAHILLENRAAAERIQRIMKVSIKDKTYAELAQENSVDEKTAKDGGVIDTWMTRENFAFGISEKKDALEKIFQTPEGKVVPDIIQSPRGYHIIRVLGSEKAHLPELESIRERVKGVYTARMREKARQQIMMEALEVNTVKIHDNKIE